MFEGCVEMFAYSVFCSYGVGGGVASPISEKVQTPGPPLVQF